MLIVETADMLQAPLFTAEALLRAHGTIKHEHTQTCAWPNTANRYLSVNVIVLGGTQLSVKVSAARSALRKHGARYDKYVIK